MEGPSDKTSALRDDELKREVEGEMRAGKPTRAEEWDDPLPPADDDPAVASGPITPGSFATEGDPAGEELRLELAKHLGRTSFPADRAELARVLSKSYAPDQLRDAVGQLPDHRTFRNVQEVVTTLGYHPR